jgi:hypothetical protein
MSNKPKIRAQSGQGTIEHVGVTVIVALLMASVALWAAQNMRAPTAPPAAVTAIVDYLDAPAPGSPQYLFQNQTNPFAGLRGRDNEPIGRALRWIGNLGRDIVVIGGPALARGFATRVKERAEEFARNPIGVVKDTIESLAEGDPNILTAIRERLGDIGSYVRSLRGLSREEIIRRVGEDLGAVGAEVVIDRGRSYLVRKGIERIRDRGSRPALDPDTP